MRRALYSAAAFAALACAGSGRESIHVGDEMRLISNGVGCSSRESLDRSRDLIRTDYVAYWGFISNPANGCRGFDSASTALIEAVDSNSVKLHTLGDPSAFWMERRMVDTAAQRRWTEWIKAHPPK